MSQSWTSKLAKGETVFMRHPTDDFVARLIPGTSYTLVKQLDGEEYSIKDTTDLATDFRTICEEITEQEYNDFGKYQKPYTIPDEDEDE
jgi:hypothetical protein